MTVAVTDFSSTQITYLIFSVLIIIYLKTQVIHIVLYNEEEKH